MHGATTKFINAQQAKLCTNYKNTKLQLLKTNGAIWFSKVCIIKELKQTRTPFYDMLPHLHII